MTSASLPKTTCASPGSFPVSKLIQFLQGLHPALSARKIKRAIEEGACRVNGKIETIASRPLHPMDRVEFHIPTSLFTPVFAKDQILHEDNNLIAYNKQAGLTCEEKNFTPYHLIHRLDKDTSGVLLLAQTEEVRKAMIELFREKRVKKSYLAIVAGHPTKAKGRIANFLAKVGTVGGQVVWGSVSPEKGEEAETLWSIVCEGKEASLILCHPITGRTHQLRVHLSEMGHPILGDLVYGRKTAHPYFAPRTLLHAEQIACPHPLTGRPYEAVAPLPPDFQQALKDLKLCKS